MKEELIIKITESLIDLAISTIKEGTGQLFNEKKLRASLKNYIENQQKYNEICSLAEEIDFQGLVDYIQNNLIEKVILRVFDPSKKTRGLSRKEIVNVAISYSKAKTKEAKDRVSYIVYNCLDIIRNFYETENLSLKDYLISDKIVDAVSEEIHEASKANAGLIESATEQIIDRIDNSSSFTVDRVMSLVEKGDFTTIGSKINQMLNHMSVEHPFKPYYGYDYNNGTIISKPLTNDATSVYPPKIVVNGLVKVGDRYYDDNAKDPVYYAYCHQQPLAIEISEAIKLLGDEKDPIQEEADKLKGKTLIAVPPEFPPAFPCSIKVNDKAYYDYVLLRTQEILDDKTYIISNREQGTNLYFEIKINPFENNKPAFKMGISSTSNKELLEYSKFMYALEKEKDLHIYMLEAKKDFIAGKINVLDYSTNILSIEKEVDLFERLCIIEEYFGIALKLPEKISQMEYHTINFISDLIKKDEVTETWSEATFAGIVTEHFRYELLNINDSPMSFSYIGNNSIELFGTEFKLEFLRTFKSAKIADIEKLFKKVEILDIGDEIKFKLVPGDNAEATVSLNIPENYKTLMNY